MVIALERAQSLPGAIVPAAGLDQLQRLEDAFGGSFTPSTFSDLVEANVQAARFTSYMNSRSAAEEEAVDRAIDVVRRETGEVIDNYTRRPGLGREPFSPGGFVRAVRGTADLPWLYRPTADEAERMQAWERNNGRPLDRQAFWRDEFEARIRGLIERYPEKAAALQPWADVRSSARAIAEAADERLRDVSARSGWGAWAAGSLVGGLAGSWYDPTFVPATAAGGVWGSGRHLVRAAVLNGAVNAGAAGAQQPWVQAWRREAGLEAGWAQAGLETAGAFAAGAALDFTARTVWRGGRMAVARAQGVDGLSVQRNLLDGVPVDNRFGMLSRGAGAPDAATPERVVPDGAAERAGPEIVAPEALSPEGLSPEVAAPEPVAPPLSRQAQAAALDKLDRAIERLPEDDVVRRAMTGDDAELVARARELGLDTDPALRGALAEVEADAPLQAALRAAEAQGIDVGRAQEQLAAMIRAVDDGDVPPALPAPERLIDTNAGDLDVLMRHAMPALEAADPRLPGMIDEMLERGQGPLLPMLRRAVDDLVAGRPPGQVAQTFVEAAVAQVDRELDVGAFSGLPRDAMFSLRGKPFQRSKLIDAGAFAVRVADDDRHVAGPWERTYYIHRRPDGGLASVRSPSRDLGGALGRVVLTEHPDGRWEVQMVEVKPSARGQGVATALYAAVEKDLGVEMQPSGILLPDGYAMWRRRAPDLVKHHRQDGDVWLSPRKLVETISEVSRQIARREAWLRIAEQGGARPVGFPDEIEFSPARIKAGVAAARNRLRALQDLLADVPPEGRTPEALDAMFSLRQGGDGERIRAYHWTDAAFERFDAGKTREAGFHFGSMSQATIRSAVKAGLPWPIKGRMIPVEIEANGVLDLPVDLPFWSGRNLSKQLVAMEIMPQDVADGLAKLDLPQSNAYVREWLVSQGYDTIRYPNRFEGDGFSYMTLGTGNVRHARSGATLYAIGDAPVRLPAVDFPEAAGPQALAQVAALEKKFGLGAGSDGQASGAGSSLQRAAVPGEAGGAAPSQKARAFVEALKGRALRPYEVEPSPFGPGFEKVAPEIEAAVLAGLDADRRRLLPAGVEVTAFRSGLDVEAIWRDDLGLIGIAADALDPRATLGHEAIHALRDRGLITDSEWGILRAGAKDWLRSDAADQYRQVYAGRPGLDDLLQEEAVAHLYEARVRDGADFGPRLNGLLDRIREVIDRIGNALRGRGFQSLEDVLARIDAGEVAARGGTGGDAADGVRLPLAAPDPARADYDAGARLGELKDLVEACRY